MSLCDIIRPRRPGAPLPVPQGRWADLLTSLRAKGASPVVQLQAVEEAGATPDEIGDLVQDYFLLLFPRFRGLSRGFRTSRRDLRPDDSELGLWCLTVFREPWRVLEALGHQPINLLRFLLATHEPSAWIEDLQLLRVPADIGRFINPWGVEVGPQTAPVDLTWLPSKVVGHFQIIGQVSLTEPLETVDCRGGYILQNVSGVQRLHPVFAQSLVVEGCVDLVALMLHPLTPTIIRGCPTLRRVHGSVSADLLVEDCPDLVNLDVILPRDAMPIPSLTIRRCPSLVWIGRLASLPRVVKHLVIEGCPALQGVRQRLIVRGHKTVTGCPMFVE